MITIRSFAACVSWLTCLLLVGAAGAATPIAHEAQPLVEPALVATCAACHGRDGLSASDDIPNLAAQKRGYLAAQLQAFRGSGRKNELMNAIARQLTDEDIATLAQWWSSRMAPVDAAKAAGVVVPESRMRFPADFPNGFVHYDTINIPDDKSVNLLYANAAALETTRRDGRPGIGAVVIVASHRTRRDADGEPLVDANGKWLPDAVQSYTGMEAQPGWGDAVPTLLRNGDWHYGLFTATGEPRVGALHARCLACHQPLANDGYLFTIHTLRAKAGEF